MQQGVSFISVKIYKIPLIFNMLIISGMFDLSRLFRKMTTGLATGSCQSGSWRSGSNRVCNGLGCYQKFVDGTIYQWGSGACQPLQSGQWFNFATTFPNQVFSVVATMGGLISTTHPAVLGVDANQWGMSVTCAAEGGNDGPSPHGFHWFAIGR